MFLKMGKQNFFVVIKNNICHFTMFVVDIKKKGDNVETFKGIIIALFVSLLWSGLCFGSGYLLCNRTATKQLERANNELTEQQQRYEELIRLADERLQRVKEELYGKVSDNGQTITELSAIIEQIGKQRIDL